MPRYKVVMHSKKTGKNAEFMVVGETLEDALEGAQVSVYLMERNRVDTDHEGKPCRPFCYDKRILVKMVQLGDIPEVD